MLLLLLASPQLRPLDSRQIASTQTDYLVDACLLARPALSELQYLETYKFYFGIRVEEM